jgi:hypothetical protein
LPFARPDTLLARSRTRMPRGPKAFLHHERRGLRGFAWLLDPCQKGQLFPFGNKAWLSACFLTSPRSCAKGTIPHSSDWFIRPRCPRWSVAGHGPAFKTPLAQRRGRAPPAFQNRPLTKSPVWRRFQTGQRRLNQVGAPMQEAPNGSYHRAGKEKSPI